jgi:uncharacterized membrane protein YfcA
VTFAALVFAVGALAGGIAAVSGFGIGSLLTPLLGLRLGVQLAVAAVSLPHLAGTLLRFLKLRERVDHGVLLSFGVASAAGGLAGALGHVYLKSGTLGLVFGALLIFAGVTGVTGLAQKLRFGRKGAWIAGIASGAFGGLVGNQGGIRSAALLGFDMSKEAFVATATAIGLVVDGARLPVYLATQGKKLVPESPLIAAALRACSWAP